MEIPEKAYRSQTKEIQFYEHITHTRCSLVSHAINYNMRVSFKMAAFFCSIIHNRKETADGFPINM